MPWMERRRERHRRMKKKHLLGLANYLTYGRIATIPVFILMLSFISPAGEMPSKWDYVLSYAATILFFLSGLTDAIDGYIARRRESTGNFGKFLDPLADKLFAATILIMLIPLDRIAAWVVVIVIVREFTVTSLRAMAVSEDLVIAASEWGKRKTFMEIFALGSLLLYYPTWGIQWSSVGSVLLFLTVIISLGSGIHYVWRFFQVVLARQKPSNPRQ